MHLGFGGMFKPIVGGKGVSWSGEKLARGWWEVFCNHVTINSRPVDTR